MLKLEYCFHLPFDKTNESMQKTENFVSRCIRLYLASKQPASTDAPGVIQSQPKDDLCLLAAMSTVKQSGYAIDQSPCPTPQSSFIQAAAILEQLLVNSPHNYEALLLLVRIYLLLGAGSMALKTFHALNVKQIQHESVSHNLFTRLSTIHPGAAPPSTGMERKDWDPQIALRIAMEFYYRSAMATEYSRTSGLEYGSYVNISESIALEHDLQHSICRKIYGLEVRRIQRLTGLEPTAQYADISMNSLKAYSSHTDCFQFLIQHPQLTKEAQKGLSIVNLLENLPLRNIFVLDQFTEYVDMILKKTNSYTNFNIRNVAPTL